MLLEKKIYSRDEILSIFNTDRIDSVKRSLRRKGYKFRNIGRGSSYQVEILELPFDYDIELEKFCIDELGFRPDIQKIKPFFYCLIYFGNDFINLTRKYMHEYMQQFNIDISYQTVCHYFNIIDGLGWIYPCKGNEYVRFSYDENKKCRVYISNTYNSKVWSKFFNSDEVIEYKKELDKLENYSELDKFNMLLHNTNAGYILNNELNNLHFRKERKKLINGMYMNSDCIDKLKSIIPYDTYKNILSVKEWLIKCGYFVGPMLENSRMNFYD